MPRSARPRKRYRPRPVSMDLVETAIARVGLLPTTPRATMVAAGRRALEQLRTGAADWSAWCNLADAMNVAEQLAAAGIASNHQPTIDAGQAALAELHARHASTGRWTLRGPELKALQDALEIHEIQLEHCTQGELADAIERVKRGVKGALNGSAPRGARICVAGALGRG